MQETNFQFIQLSSSQLSEIVKESNQELFESIKSLIKPHSNEKEYYTRKEVSKLLSVSYVTLNKWNKSGKLKAVGIGGRVLYRKVDLDSAIVEI